VTVSLPAGEDQPGPDDHPGRTTRVTGESPAGIAPHRLAAPRAQS